MSVIDRIREIEKAEEISREGLANKAGMKYTRLSGLVGGRGQIRMDDIEAIASAFPQYKHWLVFGEELPICGQISPMNKEAQKTQYKPLSKEKARHGS